MAKVSFISSDDRFYNTSRALSLIKTEITGKIKNARNVVIKTNCYCQNYQLSATHVDALDALLDFISPHVKNQMILTEGTAEGDTLQAFANYNYFSIQEKYDLAFVDLRKDKKEMIKTDNGPIFVPSTLVNSDYLISITPPKTHGFINYFGAIANTISSHNDPSAQNRNLFGSKVRIVKEKIINENKINTANRLFFNNFKLLEPSLSVIDGYSAMQADGPGNGGTLAATHWAITSTSLLESDLLSMKLLGFDEKDVTYIELAKDFLEYKEESLIVGDEWNKRINKITKHHNFSIS